MKIRSDYVTNSSATGYVVCVPTSYEPDMTKAGKILERDVFPGDKGFDETLLEIQNVIEEIQRGMEIYVYDDCSSECFFTITELLEAEGFQITTYDIHSDGEYLIVPVRPEVIENMFLNIHKDKLLEIKKLFDGGEDVTPETK